jgi:hypothetical protein
MLSSNKITINHVCSLGTICQTSQICKDLRLKLESYPFDWIFSTPEIILDALEEDFSSFLDKDLYKGLNDKLCSHLKYALPNRNMYMFMHHNPKDNVDHYNYLVRCVDRFRKLLASTSNKLFIIFYSDKIFTDIKANSNFTAQINKSLSTKTTNYFLAAINHISGQNNYVCSVSSKDNVKQFTLNTKSTTNGSRLVCLNENSLLLQQIQNSYTFQPEKLI